MTSDVNTRLSIQLNLQGISQRKLAQLSGLTESTISHYIKGSRSPNSENLRRIATALNVPVSALISTDDTTYAQDINEIKSIILKRRSQWTDKQKLEVIESLFVR